MIIEMRGRWIEQSIIRMLGLICSLVAACSMMLIAPIRIARR
jgi:hypothetical protein